MKTNGVSSRQHLIYFKRMALGGSGNDFSPFKRRTDMTTFNRKEQPEELQDPQQAAGETTFSETSLVELLAPLHIDVSSQQSASLDACLVELGSRQKFPVKIPRCLIGRERTNDIIVRGDPTVSRHHCVITFEEGQYFIEDLASRNGTFIGGTRVNTRRCLTHNEQLRVGLTRFEFLCQDQDESDMEEADRGAAVNVPHSRPSAGSDDVTTGCESVSVYEDDDVCTVELPEANLREVRAGRLRDDAGSSRATDELLTTQPRPVVPDWCSRYLRVELEEKRAKVLELSGQIALLEQERKDTQDLILRTERLRNALLLSSGVELAESCAHVFERFGYRVRPSEADERRLYLRLDDAVVAIAYVSESGPVLQAADVAELVKLQIAYWCEHLVEPKGVLIANPYEGQAPSEGSEEGFSEDLIAYAGSKNIVLITTLQLLSIYKEVDLGGADLETIRRELMSAAGSLTCSTLEPAPLAV
ncbi:MAG TPA: FHA domain-containing protein [Candidatus Obscuribacterales bacterium]